MTDWIDKAATEIETAIRQHGAEYDVTFAAIIRKHVPKQADPMAYAVFCQKYDDGLDYRIFAEHEDAKVYANDQACEEGDEVPEVIPLFRRDS